MITSNQVYSLDLLGSIYNAIYVSKVCADCSFKMEQKMLKKDVDIKEVTLQS